MKFMRLFPGLRTGLAAGAGAVLAIGVQGGAGASTLVFGGLGKTCYQLAKAGQDTPDALKACTIAIEEEAMIPKDRAATYVNRGVIRTNRKEWPAALEDFREAQEINPALGEAYVSEGVVHAYQQRYPEAIAAIDRGLSLRLAEPEKAYFNRGVARLGMNNVRGAYEDYKKAAELKPDWLLAQERLSWFVVSSAPR